MALGIYAEAFMQNHINGMTNLKCLSQISVSPNYIQTEYTSTNG